MRYSLLLVLGALLLAGCTSSTSPNSTNIAGTWTLTSDDLSGGGNSCSLTGQVQVTQSGHTLGGNLPGNGVVVTCVNGDTQTQASSAGTNLVSGTINGTTVSFNLATGAVIGSGAVTGAGTMAGSSVTANYPTSNINVTGTWTAALNH